MISRRSLLYNSIIPSTSYCLLTLSKPRCHFLGPRGMRPWHKLSPHPHKANSQGFELALPCCTSSFLRLTAVTVTPASACQCVLASTRARVVIVLIHHRCTVLWRRSSKSWNSEEEKHSWRLLLIEECETVSLRSSTRRLIKRESHPPPNNTARVLAYSASSSSPISACAS